MTYLFQKSIANSEDDYSTVQDGLVFNGIYAPRDNIADYDGVTILEDDLVLESVHGAAGIPYNKSVASSGLIIHGEAI